MASEDVKIGVTEKEVLEETEAEGVDAVEAGVDAEEREVVASVDRIEVALIARESLTVTVVPTERKLSSFLLFMFSCLILLLTTFLNKTRLAKIPAF